MNALGPYMKLSQWELAEVLRRFRDTRILPDGQRHNAVKRIAADYRVSDRTIYRWSTKSLTEVRVANYRALFTIGAKGPVRVTGWERVRSEERAA